MRNNTRTSSGKRRNSKVGRDIGDEGGTGTRSTGRGISVRLRYGCSRPRTDHIEGPYRLVSDKIVQISISISRPTLDIGRYINIDISTHPRYRRDIAIAVSRYALAKRAVGSILEHLEHFRSLWEHFRAIESILGAFGSIWGA